MTKAEFFDVFTPLLLALHDRKVLDLAELPYYYEDVLARRKLDLKQDTKDLAFLEEVVQSLHRLSAVALGGNRQT